MAENFPHPIPNGWFQLAYDDEIAPGEVQTFEVFGQQLVAFRGESGVVTVTEPYCPHLGAHLGFGGRIEGDTLVCPFHAWRYDTTGACVEIPYAQKIPPKARLRTWPSRVVNGGVYVWRHADGADPFYEIPALPQLEQPDRGGWSAPRRHEWTIRAQFQETFENVVDPAHFRYVHGTKTMPDTEITFEDFQIRSKNLAKMQTGKGTIDGCIDAISVGPGFGYTHYQMGGEMLQVGGSIPLDAYTTKTRFAFYIRTTDGADPDRGLGAAMIGEIRRQMGQDIPIWENKTYLAQPLLCDADGPIPKLRDWMQQFYSQPVEPAA